MNAIGTILFVSGLLLLAWQIGPMWAVIAMLIYIGIGLMRA